MSLQFDDTSQLLTHETLYTVFQKSSPV